MLNYQIDRNRWAQMSIFEQMGNIGSEVGRAISARRANREDRVEGAIIRALDLFSATVEVNLAQFPHRAREVLLARDQFLALFYEDTFEDDAENIERYFMQYALAARRER
jgi:hypothetical protein